MKRKGMFKFLLPYFIILGVIIVLFVIVGNGSTQSTNVGRHTFTQLVEVQKNDGYVINDKGTEDTSDDSYFKVKFNKVAVEEGSTVTGFSGTFTLAKQETAPDLTNLGYVVYARDISDRNETIYSFSFIVSNGDVFLKDTYVACDDLQEFDVYYTTNDASRSGLGLTLLINFLPLIIMVVLGFFLFRSLSKQGGGGAGGAVDFGKSTA